MSTDPEMPSMRRWRDVVRVEHTFVGRNTSIDAGRVCFQSSAGNGALDTNSSP